MRVEVDYEKIPPRHDLVPLEAANVVAQVFGYGALKHKKDDWLGIPAHEHITKALRHLEELRALTPQDTPREDHLANALCRLYMAVEVRKLDKGEPS